MSATLQDMFAFEGPIEAAVSTLIGDAGVTAILTRGQYAYAKDTHVEVRLDPGAADPASLMIVGAGMEYISREGHLEISVSSDRRLEKTNTGPRLLHDAILANVRAAMIRANASALNALIPNHIVTDMRDNGVSRTLANGIDVSVQSFTITFELKLSSWPSS
jgi:hypothetical protein